MKTPILGSTYVARSVNAADARMVNLFPEVIPEAGTEPGFLMRAVALAAEPEAACDPIDPQWVRHALGGNLCRCTGYEGIVKAVCEGLVAMRTAAA